MKLYDKIWNSIRQIKKTLHIDSIRPESEVRHAIRWVMRDNPDIFWFAHQYHYDEASSTIHFQYTFSAERVKTIQQSINDVIENDFCIEYAKTLTRQQQIAYIYKWLISYCNYNANSASNQSIDSVFVRRNSVCTGYAKAAQYLFNLLGIESRLVFGQLHNDKEDGRHCWNLVKVDNEYYHFDACFGDSILDSVALKSGIQELFKVNGINYNFLCASTDEMLKTRSIEDIETLPECPISWSTNLIISLAGTEIKKREEIKGCLLSHIGSSADIYLCSKDKNTVLKVFRPNSKTRSQEEYHYMQQTKGCQHLLQCHEQYTDIAQSIVAIEQSTPIVDLLCSHYYELSLKGVIKMATDVAQAWKECQERGVLYRDIHVCNIYRSDYGTFKLGDFGSCTNDFGVKEIVGNQWFMAPETFLSGIFTEASAVYSISMVMYFILNKLRPAFWIQDKEHKALARRLNGNDLPTPDSCVNLPIQIRTALDNFFKKVSAVFIKERTRCIADFIYELESLAFNCKDCDYIIHHKGFCSDFGLDAGNKDRLNARHLDISYQAYHKYVMGDQIEQMCTSICLDAIDTNSCNGTMSVDAVEDFARTAGVYSNDEWSYEDFAKTAPDNHSDSESWSDWIFDEGKCMSIDGEKCMSSPTNSECHGLSYNHDNSLAPSTSDALDWNSFLDEFIKYQDKTDPVFSNRTESVYYTYESVCPISSSGKTGCSATTSVVSSREKHHETINNRKVYETNCSTRTTGNNLEKESVILKKQYRLDEVYSSIFAPAEVKRKSHLQVQVYLHLYDESETVKSLAKESDKNAERRDYIPLSLKLKKGDKVDIEFNIYGETRLASERKSIIWQGSFTKCSFNYFVPKYIDVDELSCEANLFVNGAMIGEMRFLTQIVEVPRNLNPEILSHRFNRIFISYAHQDAQQIKLLALAYKAQGVDYFYDRDSLAPGDVYEEKIFDYIDSSDLFVLCWSKNAAVSDYVAKEKARALLRAYPQLSQRDATLKICPISIEPRADLPSDMKEVYNFEVI